MNWVLVISTDDEITKGIKVARGVCVSERKVKRDVRERKRL